MNKHLSAEDNKVGCMCADADRPCKRARITRGSLVGSTEGLQLEIGIVGACDDAGHELLEVR